MAYLIKNVNVVTKEEIIYGGCVLIEDGKIAYVGKDAPNCKNFYDGEGRFLLPGFIDIHCHGGNGYDFMDSTKEEMLGISKFHLSHGTTTLYATTLTDKMEYIERALEEFSKIDKKSTLVGVHLEGPWFNAKECGAQDVSTMQTASTEKLESLLVKYPFIKRVSVAPETENGLEVGAYGSKKGVVMSIGHTDAEFDDVEKAIKNGYTLLTHFYSGMKGVTRKNAYRVAGAVEAGYYFDELFVEIIADGKHLPKTLLKLIYKIKGADKICLITDGMRASGFSDGQTSFLGRKEQNVPVIVEDGVAKLLDRQAFAGSVATCDRLFRTMADAIGDNWIDLMKMSSLTPAKVMGLSDRGEIAVGKRADLVIMDKNYKINKVILEGEDYEGYTL